ncbi:MAG: flavin reductase family protein [Clostridia bacterium]|nr:flavin reductase family protein [Clostridia bacterium]
MSEKKVQGNNRPKRTTSSPSQNKQKTVKPPPSHTKKVEWKGSTLLGALPSVMVSCGDMEKPNIITVAWTGIICSQPPMTYISVRPERYSHHLIKESGVFVINLTPTSMVRECDYCGIYTGAKVDKFAACGFDAVPSPTVGAPMIAQAPVSLSCRVKEVVSLGTHDMFIADIVGISASEALLDEKGKLHMEWADLCVSMHGAYYGIGKFLGKLGFSTDKKGGQNG